MKLSTQARKYAISHYFTLQGVALSSIGVMNNDKLPSISLSGHDFEDSIALQRDHVSQSLFLKSKEDLNDTSNQFVPRSALFDVISEKRVFDIAKILLREDVGDGSLLSSVAIRISPPENDACHCNDLLCTGSRITFAALLLTSRHDILIPFLKYPNIEFCDGKLPLKDPQSIWKGKTMPEEFEDLTVQQTRVFLHWQNRMRAPFFKPSTNQTPQVTGQQSDSLEVEDAVTLPWVNVEAISRLHNKVAHQSTSGDRSLIQRITIDSAHHSLVSFLCFLLSVAAVQSNGQLNVTRVVQMTVLL
jgi:hypothetical protein